MQLTNLFTYGTLMYPEVMNFILSNKQFKSCKAVLKNYLRRQVKGEQYPGIKPCQGAQVEGVLYYDLTAQDLRQLDSFQNDRQNYVQYAPANLKVTTEKGQELAYVYTYINPSNLQQKQWDVEHFQKMQLPKYKKK